MKVVPNDKPPDVFAVRSIEIDVRELETELEQYVEVWGNRRLRREVNKWKKEMAAVRTMYKRKGRKINPVDAPLKGGVNPGGGVNSGGLLSEGETETRDLEPWRLEGTVVQRGSRLTPERLAQMRIGGDFLSEAEKQLFVDILFNYEGAIAFDDTEMGMLKSEIEPPIIIHTVPHKPWQQPNLRLPKAMQEIATKIVKDKLARGMLEHSQAPYRSRFFLVPKENSSKSSVESSGKSSGDYRFINDMQPLNAVTIRDAGMPPSVDEFSEDFAMYPILTSVDYYSGYNQLSLDAQSRDLTSFLTDAGLVRQTRLPQGWTNSVAVFQRAIVKVHWKQIPDNARPFLDDVGLRGPKSRYDDVEISPGVRKFVWEHAQIFRQFMHDVWVSGMTISGTKTVIGMPGIKIVGMVCDSNGRHPEQKKIQKILNWPTPRTTKEARGFVGIVVYYRIFIVGFAIIAAPIFVLFRKGVRFKWTAECQVAMDTLKRLLTEAPILISLDFSPNALAIILNVDASTTIGWGVILSQIQPDGRPRPARYESGIWNEVELKYDAVKLECRGLLKALKKLRFWLYGRHFYVETDAQTLVWLLNQPPNDLPNAMMTRWLAYIRLFDFTVKHVPGKKNGGADALSRRGYADGDEEEDQTVDEYFDAKIYSIEFSTMSFQNPTARVYLHEGEYDGEYLLIGRYLESMERPLDITDDDFRRLRRKAFRYLVRDGYLYKRSKKGRVPPRRVIGRPAERQEVIASLHDEVGHRSRQTTYDQVARRYQWDGMYEDIAQYVKSCEECQRRARVQYEEPLHPTWSLTVWAKVGVDVVYMPESTEGYKFIVFARDDLSGWVEGRAIKDNTAQNVAKFLYEDVICRHGCPGRIIVDGGSENKKVAEALLANYGVQRTVVSAYHPQTNGLVERGHDAVVNSLSKYCSKEPEKWPQYLPLVLWADRISVRRTTGYTAFELVYGRECLLPIDLSLTSWSVVDWEGEVKTREDLLVARMRQLDERVLMESRAAAESERSRKGNKVYFDQHKRMRGTEQQLHVGDLVLLHRSQNTKSRSLKKKLDDRWFGPYRVREIPANSTFYLLEELDGTHLKSTFAGDRLKRFFSRVELDEDRAGRHNVIRVRDALEAEEGAEEGLDVEGEELE